MRPQVTVHISGEVPTASLPTETGQLFFVYAGTTGPTTPTRVTSSAQAETAGVPTATAAWIGDAIAQGAPAVIVVRAAAADADAVTEQEWAAALDLLTPSYGPGQVTIPGVATEAARAALLAHAHANPQRIAYLDVAENATAADITTLAAAAASTPGAERAGLFAPWVSVPAAGGPRKVPASLIAAGLTARGDAETGTANHTPMFEQSRAAGVVRGAVAVSTAFSDSEADDLYDAGANTFRIVGGVVTLTGFKSLGGDGVWRQLNIGRLTMEISARVSSLMYQYLGAPIDGRGILLSQIGGDITGYLLGLYNANALFGETPDEAFSVVCDFTNNTVESIRNGEVHANVSIVAATAAEQIVINVVTSLAG